MDKIDVIVVLYGLWIISCIVFYKVVKAATVRNSFSEELPSRLVKLVELYKSSVAVSAIIAIVVLFFNASTALKLGSIGLFVIPVVLEFFVGLIYYRLIRDDSKDEEE